MSDNEKVKKVARAALKGLLPEEPKPATPPATRYNWGGYHGGYVDPYEQYDGYTPRRSYDHYTPPVREVKPWDKAREWDQDWEESDNRPTTPTTVDDLFPGLDDDDKMLGRGNRRSSAGVVPYTADEIKRADDILKMLDSLKAHPDRKVLSTTAWSIFVRILNAAKIAPTNADMVALRKEVMGAIERGVRYK